MTETVLKRMELAFEGPRTRADAVFDLLLEAIVRVELKPGEALLKEEIAKRLGVSRTPVGDAFARLAGLGLVTVVPQVGSFVSRLSAQAILESSYLRSAVEAQIVHDLASRANRTLVGGLRRQLEAQEKCVATDDVDHFHDLDDTFHRELMEAAGYGGLWDQIAASRLHLVRIRRLGLPRPGRLADAYSEHALVVEEIAAQRPRKAAKAMTAHIRYGENDLRRLERDSPEYFV